VKHTELYQLLALRVLRVHNFIVDYGALAESQMIPMVKAKMGD
jgi:hypothetical protein